MMNRHVIFRFFLYSSLLVGVSPPVWSCLTRPYWAQLDERAHEIMSRLSTATTVDQKAEGIAQLKDLIDETDQELLEVQTLSLLAREWLAAFLQHQNRPIEALETYSEWVLRKWQRSEELEFSVYAGLLKNVRQDGIAILGDQFYESLERRESGKALTVARKMMNAADRLRANGELNSIAVEALAVELYEFIFKIFDPYISLNFLEGLYRDTKIGAIAPFISYLYVEQVVRKKYRNDDRVLQESIELLKPLLDQKRFHFSNFYTVFSFLYMQLERYLDAIQVLAHANTTLIFPGVKNNYFLGSFYLVHQYYNEGIDVFEDLLKMGDLLFEYGVDPKQLRKAFVAALQKAGRQDEASFFLKKMLEESLNWRLSRRPDEKQSGVDIQVQGSREWKSAEAQAISPRPKSEMIASLEDQTSLLKPSPLDSVFAVNQWSQVAQATHDLSTLPKKTKVKSRKALETGLQNTAPTVSDGKAEIAAGQDFKELRQLKTVEEILDSQPQILAIFYKFFSNFEDQHVRVGAIDLSMDEVSRLMEALGQDFDSSKGKGSHTKVTLRRSDLQPDLENAPDEQMIVLAKHTKLIGAQIADIRNRFLSYYLFPRHLKDVLVRKQLLPF